MVGPFILASGCSNELIDVDHVKSDIIDRVNGSRVCAVLISHSLPIIDSSEHLSSSSVNALVAAGLISRKTVYQDVKGHAFPNTQIVINPQYKTDFRVWTNEGHHYPQLCFGKRRITSFRIKGGERAFSSDNPNDPVGPPVIFLRYRVVDSPAWTHDAAIRKSFPFMARMLEQEQEAKAPISWSQGKWKIDDDPEGSLNSGITKFFGACDGPALKAQSNCG